MVLKKHIFGHQLESNSFGNKTESTKIQEQFPWIPPYLSELDTSVTTLALISCFLVGMYHIVFAFLSLLCRIQLYLRHPLVLVRFHLDRQFQCSTHQGIDS